MDGGIKIIEILNKSNIIALVGNGSNTNQSPKKVLIWDDLQQKVISEVKFNSDIKNVKINSFNLFIVCQNKIYVFNLNDLKKKDDFTTYDNPKGVFSLSTYPEESIIAFPFNQRGYVGVKRYGESVKDFKFWAHSSGIGCVSLNREGNLICTASENGTLVRVFNAETGDIGYEFRRGKDKAEIFSLSFDYDSDFIACTSDRGTVHFFALVNPGNEGNNEQENKENEDGGEKKSKHVFQKTDSHEGFFGTLSKYIFMPTGYLKAQRSFSQFRIPDIKPYCSFYGDSENSKVFIASTDGKFYKIDFDKSLMGEIPDANSFDLQSKL